MLTPIETYRELGRQAASAHKRVMTQGCGRYDAGSLFEMLWRCLDAENLTDHCDARAAFNAAFGAAYRGTPTEPHIAAAYRAMSPAKRTQIGQALGDDKAPPRPAPAPRKASASAAACAAFFAASTRTAYAQGDE